MRSEVGAYQWLHSIFYTEQINLITLVIAFMVLAILFVENTLGIGNALFCATGRVLLW
jgi:Na+/H+ antiporter NhaA